MFIATGNSRGDKSKEKESRSVAAGTLSTNPSKAWQSLQAIQERASPALKGKSQPSILDTEADIARPKMKRTQAQACTLDPPCEDSGSNSAATSVNSDSSYNSYSSSGTHIKKIMSQDGTRVLRVSCSDDYSVSSIS